MVQFDQATGMISLPIWVSAAVAAVLVVLAIMALVRSGAFKTLFALLALGVVVYGSWMGWHAFERFGNTERVEQRRAFDQRVAELMGRATVPGSPLSCLEGTALEQVVTGCEKVLFESPENVASAVAFVTARISLLVDGLDIASHSQLNYDNALNVLRRGLEMDRFGVVAHVMSQQPNCLPQQCEMLILLRDANKIRVNLQDKPFEALVAKYSPQWSQPVRPESTRNSNMPPPPAPLSSRFDLPSSASIPPVSIMNTEQSPPAGSPPASAAAPANQNATGTTATPPRRPPAVRAPVPRAPGEAAPPPVPLAPGTSGPPTAASPPPPVR